MKFNPFSMFNDQSNALAKEAKPMARPALTEKMLSDTRSRVRSQPFAGKGIFSIEQLENDAIIALWNECVAAEREAEAMTLKTVAPASTTTAKAG